MSNTKKINECRKLLISTFSAFAYLAQDWNPKDEQDFDQFEDSINSILERFIKDK